MQNTNTSTFRIVMIRNFLPALLVFVAGASGTSACHAQWSFSFGYSEGYRHHHHPHWHGYYGGWYRPYYYVAPPPVYVTPTVVTPVVPVQPAISVAAPIAAPVAAAQPAIAPTAAASTTAAPAVVKSNALPAYGGTGVTIRNPAASGGEVAFVVDERLQMQLAPGEAAPLKEKASYTVTFDRGGDFGTTHRVLGEGIYEFVATEKGWELRRESTDAAAPNLPTVRRNELPQNVLR
ncbi:MAG: hypothetical protein QM775_36125 [Pirellulales bacterium]